MPNQLHLELAERKQVSTEQRSGEATSPASSVLTPEAKRAANEMDSVQHERDDTMTDAQDNQEGEQNALEPLRPRVSC